MLKFDPSALQVGVSFVADSYAATANGTAIDVSVLSGDLLIIVDVEKGTGTTPTLDFTVEHSYDNSTFAAVDAGDLYDPATGDAATFDQVAAAADSHQELALRREKLRQYVRLVATLAGTTPAFVLYGEIVGYNKYTDNF